MNRWISNIVLGLFTLVLVTAYGVAKQPPAYSLQEIFNLQSKKATTVAGGEQVGTQKTESDSNKTVVVLAGGKSINVTVADDGQSRTQGLSGQESLLPGNGMLFVFETDGSHPIWMKDMKFSIDIVWLSADKKVIHIEKQVPPPVSGEANLPTYQSPESARFVLELPSGGAAAGGIELGEVLEWS